LGGQSITGKQWTGYVIPRLVDQNLCAHVRNPKVMMRQG
jgi:hypothetical protein